MTATTDDEMIRQVVLDLIEEIEILSADFDEQVGHVVEAAREAELPVDVAERLYTRIVGVLRRARGVDDGGDVADEVRRLLAASLADHESEDKGHWGTVNLVDRNGLRPHLVRPVPSFNNLPVAMWEGYADVLELGLWQGNLRVELHVAEFRERNQGREPEDDELLHLMYGELFLPSQKKKDPFAIVPLAKSIARKGVERPPILTSDGEPKDGNRRIAASRFVLEKKEFSQEEKERARWIKVWVAPPGTTQDQFDAVVVSLNFEDDLKQTWPEYVKARMVVGEYRSARENVRGRFTASQETALKRNIADQFSISVAAVTRYLRMVQWAEDFESYHVDERHREPAEVRYKADDIFQWFYEIQAGRDADKITNQLDDDDDLRRMVYDLMFDVMDAGTQVRGLWKIVADPEAMQQLQNAYERLQAQDKNGALELVKEAVISADRNTATRKKIGFESFLLSCVDRLGGAPPDNWHQLNSKLLKDLRRVFFASIGTIDAELITRGEKTPPTGE